MLGYAAADVVDRTTPADLSDTDELIARARTRTDELETPIRPGFDALVFKASRGIERTTSSTCCHFQVGPRARVPAEALKYTCATKHRTRHGPGGY